MFSVRGKIVDVETGTIEDGELLVSEGKIVSQGEPETILDYSGRYIVPGFIDAHVHIESSLLTPSSFASAVLSRGTVAVVTDPHEIANVKGIEGIDFILSDSEKIPLSVFFTAPSCVPATPMETSGAELGPDEIRSLLKHPRCVALGEVMNFPGVVNSDPVVMEKIQAAKDAGKPIDGHAPGLTGEALKKYINAGISTDHECTTMGEALEKLSLGMKVMIREGSSMRNLKSLAPVATEENIPDLFLVSDDIHPETILREGHIDRILRRAASLGIEPVHALRMVTVNPARHYGLQGLGSLAPGSRASFAVLEDLREFRVLAVFVNGEKIAENGILVKEFLPSSIPEGIRSSVNIRPFTEDCLKIRSASPSGVNVIRLFDEWDIERLESDGEFLLPSREKDVLPLAVIERHRATGNIGRGFVRGFSLKRGALASTVAHDSHNIIAAGDYPDILSAVQVLQEAGGGIVALDNGRILGLLELPAAGLMTTQSAEEASQKLEKLHTSVNGLGCMIDSPFMALAFLALPVIPRLKLTDKGLVDVKSFRTIDVRV